MDQTTLRVGSYYIQRIQEVLHISYLSFWLRSPNEECFCSFPGFSLIRDLGEQNDYMVITFGSSMGCDWTVDENVAVS